MLSYNNVSVWTSTVVVRECRLGLQRVQEKAVPSVYFAFCCEPFVGPVGTAFSCALRGPRRHSLTTTLDVHTLTLLQENSLADDFYFCLIVRTYLT